MFLRKMVQVFLSFLQLPLPRLITFFWKFALNSCFADAAQKLRRGHTVSRPPSSHITRVDEESSASDSGGRSGGVSPAAARVSGHLAAVYGGDCGQRCGPHTASWPTVCGGLPSCAQLPFAALHRPSQWAAGLPIWCCVSLVFFFLNFGVPGIFP